MSKLVFTPEKNVLSKGSHKISYLPEERDRWTEWFKKNASLIFRFQDEILADSRMASFMIPELPGGAYIGSMYFTAKVMILCWKNVPVYRSGICPKCGAHGYIYLWRGIPTSGTCSASAWCPECNEVFHFHAYPFREKWNATNKIAQQCVTEEDPLVDRPSIDEFINFVEGLSNETPTDSNSVNY